MITLSMASKDYRLCIQIIAFILFSLSGANLTYSQKFIIGIKAGATFSKSSFDDKDDNDAFTNLWKPGYFGAALINFPLNKNFSFQTETGFSQRGRKIEFNDNTWLNNASYHFIDASMNLRKSFPLNWMRNVKSGWFINLGPKVSYWLSGKGKVTGGDNFDYEVKFEKQPENPNTADFNTMYMSDINHWHFGLDFGVGVDAPTLALQRFMIELRYTSGLTFYGEKNSAFNPTPGFTDNLRANENVISLFITYVLNRDIKKGNSAKNKKPRKNFDSLLH